MGGLFSSSFRALCPVPGLSNDQDSRNLAGRPGADELVNSPFNLQPVGTGPFRFDHLITEEGQIQGVALSAFKDYYGEPPFIDQVIVRYYPDAQSALEAYRQGDVLGISQIPAEMLPDALKQSELKVYTGRLPHLTLVYLNLDHPNLQFFQDPALRRALLLGTNRQWMIDHLLQGQGILADGPIFPGTWAYYGEIERPNYDPKGALALLKEAGYTIAAEGGDVRSKDGSELSFELVHPDTATHLAIAEAIQRDWAKLGVKVTLKAVPYEELVADYLNARTYQAALVDLNMARSPDPDPYPFWDQAQAKSGQNFAQWDDRQASEFLEQARITVDVGERMKAYRNFQVRFSMEMPALPLFYPVYSYGVDEQVQRVRISSFFDDDRFNTITTWFLEFTQPQ
jgi:peptide/nickel transport system substrate-binding protein